MFLYFSVPSVLVSCYVRGDSPFATQMTRVEAALNGVSTVY